ncbi:hypothetical protein [Mesobacillus jeotgali]|uniref:hypothetical protein n=1 Tax=Mesobacillus jeotgali TaxID=129985 RepID=UPI0009A79269|nr:hypothetical protein [Mesobacillus jeotgali]
MFSIILLVAVLLCLIFKNKEEIQKISHVNKLFVTLAFLLIISLSGLAIYYVGSWVSSFIDNKSFDFLFRLAWIVFIIGVAGKVWETTINKVRKEMRIN